MNFPAAHPAESAFRAASFLNFGRIPLPRVDYAFALHASIIFFVEGNSR